jgi:hypothetical protein
MGTTKQLQEDQGLSGIDQALLEQMRLLDNKAFAELVTTIQRNQITMALATGEEYDGSLPRYIIQECERRRKVISNV